MDFGPNVSPVEVIKKGVFSGIYFRNIYSGVNDKFYESTWKEFKELKNIEKKFMLLVFTMSVLINMVLNVEHH